MQWTLSDRGFLPSPDPLTHLGDPSLETVELLGKRLPELVSQRRFRDAVAEYLSPRLNCDDFCARATPQEIERLFLLFSYFASAYVHSPGLPPVQRLPAEIAIPLVRLARHCGRPPILSYASYCLHNWRRLNPSGPIALGNLELLQNFSVPGDGKEDEDWFILVHVDIEARAGSGLCALQGAKQSLAAEDAPGVERILEAVASSLNAMNRTMARMPEGCRPEVYFRKVRPYIFGFDEVVYEGCFDNLPQNYRGETGAQSSIVPTFLSALGVEHKSSLLTTHLEDMRHYMPPSHRQFIGDRVNLRGFAAHSVSANGSGRRLADLYNGCLDEIIAFRSKHFEYAVNYVQRRCSNPLATGGTPYVPWLAQLIEETRANYL